MDAFCHLTGGGKSSADGNNEVFVKTVNISQKKKTEALREKLEAQKEKRRIQNKLRSFGCNLMAPEKMFLHSFTICFSISRDVKGLAESDSDEDVGSWVSKNRKIGEEKRKAEHRVRFRFFVLMLKMHLFVIIVSQIYNLIK